MPTGEAECELVGGRVAWEAALSGRRFELPDAKHRRRKPQRIPTAPTSPRATSPDDLFFGTPLGMRPVAWPDPHDVVMANAPALG